MDSGFLPEATPDTTSTVPVVKGWGSRAVLARPVLCERAYARRRRRAGGGEHRPPRALSGAPQEG
eukprot:11354499-Alexandrium_andersonii.AAC.1